MMISPTSTTLTTSHSELERARRALRDAQRDFHIARQAVLRARGYPPLVNFVGNQIVEIEYEHHRDALYAALSWLWDVQQRMEPRTWIWIDELHDSMRAHGIKDNVLFAGNIPAMTARRKEAA